MVDMPATYFQISDIPLYCDFAKRGTVVVIDTETTGFHDSDEVVQLAVVVVKDGEEKIGKAVYIKSRNPIDGTEAQQVNGITDAILAANGLDPIIVLNDFLSLLKSTIAVEGRVLLVAHNLSFDWRMLANMLERYGCQDIPTGVVPCCTLEFVKSLGLPKTILPRNKLSSCIEAFNLPANNSHNALDDARACLELFKFLTA